MLTNFSLSYPNPNYLHITGSGDFIPSKEIAFLHTLAHNEVFMRSKKIVSLRREHGITMPIIELDYTYYPFKMTLRSLTSLARVFPDDKFRGYREVFEASPAEAEGTHVVINLRYPTGQSSRTISSMVFTKPGGDLSPDLDRMLDRCCIFRVQVS